MDLYWYYGYEQESPDEYEYEAPIESYEGKCIDDDAQAIAQAAAEEGATVSGCEELAHVMQRCDDDKVKSLCCASCNSVGGLYGYAWYSYGGSMASMPMMSMGSLVLPMPSPSPMELPPTDVEPSPSPEPGIFDLPSPPPECIDDDASAVVTAAALGVTVSGCAELAVFPTCADATVSYFCCATCESYNLLEQDPHAAHEHEDPFENPCIWMFNLTLNDFPFTLINKPQRDCGDVSGRVVGLFSACLVLCLLVSG